MLSIQNILVPTDFSEASMKAYYYALQFAHKYNASITVLHASGSFSVPIPDMMGHAMLEVRKSESQEALHTFINEAPTIDDVPVSQMVEMGSAENIIIETAKDEGFDLIIMGMQGEHNLAEKLFGSVTTYVVEHASCPVLAVPNHNDWLRDIHHIAFATSMHPEQNALMPDIIKIAEPWDASIHAVHIDIPDGQTEALNIKVVRKEMQPHAIDVAYDFTDYPSDSVQNGLEAFVKERNIDLLVMYKPQRNFFQRLFHISQTKRMAFEGNIPVLILR